MMQQIAPGKYKMAHYAFATGIMNLGMMIPSMLSGFISDWLGYRDFFIWVMIATIPSFLVSWLVPFREVEQETPSEEANRYPMNLNCGHIMTRRIMYIAGILLCLACTGSAQRKEIIGYFPSWKWNMEQNRLTAREHPLRQTDHHQLRLHVSPP